MWRLNKFFWLDKYSTVIYLTEKYYALKYQFFFIFSEKVFLCIFEVEISQMLLVSRIIESENQVFSFCYVYYQIDLKRNYGQKTKFVESRLKFVQGHAKGKKKKLFVSVATAWEILPLPLIYFLQHRNLRFGNISRKIV